jgi:CheY-like chemotaxis protein
LIVEDSEEDVGLIRRSLRSLDVKHPVVIARDGQEAVSIYKEMVANQRRPALILLDLKLPKMNGREVLIQLKAIDGAKLSPIVIFSSSEAPEDLNFAFAHGARAYVTKPVDLSEFSLAIERIYCFWMLTNEQA